MGMRGVKSQVEESDYWARAAEVAIGEYLKGVKAGTGRREVEVGLRQVYPFGERKAFPYRYRAWLEVMKRMVDEYFEEGQPGIV